MDAAELQELFELGQDQLERMDYLRAERTLAKAADIALEMEQFDRLAAICLPLQEARRQRRQRCGEGMICLDLIARGPENPLDPEKIVAEYPHGQLLVAGWETFEPAVAVRRIAAEKLLPVETFLAVAHAAEVAIYPLANIREAAITIPISDLPRGTRRGNAETFGYTMNLWERLHAPFLAAVNSAKTPREKIAACRKAIEVDYACELAHQYMAAAAEELETTNQQSPRRQHG